MRARTWSSLCSVPVSGVSFPSARSAASATPSGRWLRQVFASLIVAALATFAGTNQAQSQTAHFSYSLQTLGGNSVSPAGIAVDNSGNVYFTAPNANAVYEMPATCTSSSCVTSLGGGFSFPAGVAVDSSGNVYVADSGNNAIKEMPPNCTSASFASSGCSTTVLAPGYSFNDPEDVVIDGSGNVYVTDTNNHQVDEMPPNCSLASCVTVLATGFTFTTPDAVALDGSDNLYVADFGANAVDELQPNCLSASCVTPLGGGAFNGPAGITVDGSGNVYVADNNDSVLDVMPPNCTSSSCVSVQSSGYLNPYRIASDSSGDIFAADYGHSEVKEISIYSANFYTVPVRTASSVRTLTFTFDSGGTISAPAVLTAGISGLDFADAGTGTCTTNGTGYTYKVGDTCTVDVTFTPTVAGSRYGAVVLHSSGGAPIATGYLQGIGTGPQVAFPPGVQLEVATTDLGYPFGVAVDGSGDIYITDYFDQAVRKFAPSGGGTYTMLANVASGSISPTGIAVDGAGNVYFADYANNAVLKFALDESGGYVQLADVASTGLSSPEGVAVDGNGNVYVADCGNNAIHKYAPNGTGGYTQLADVADTGLDNPYGVAVDRNGNVYVADNDNNAVHKYAPNGSGGYKQLADVANTGLSNPQGVAVDGNGNVYVTSTGNGTVLEYSLNGSGGYNQPIDLASTGLIDPVGVAVESNGNVDFTDSAHNRVLSIDIADPPSLSFNNTAVDSTSSDSPQTVTLENLGNASLTFPTPTTGQNPSISANFAIDSSATCPILGSSSSPATLAAGTSCTLPVNFTPTAAGSITGSLVLTDTNLNASPSTTQTIPLNGLGVDITLSPSTTTLPNGTVGVAYNQTFTASGGSTSSYTYSSSTLPGGLILSPSGTLSGTPTAAVTNFTFTVTATDGNSAAGSQTYTITIVPGTASVTLGGLSQTYTGSPISATATTNPSGLTVDFTYNGSTTPPTTVGSYAVVATINDPNYTGSTTGTLMISRATPVITWATPASIPYGTALSGMQLDATATGNGSPVAGTFTYNPAAGTVLSVGTHALTVSFVPSDTIDYSTPASASVSITVTQGTLTVTANNATRVYGTANPAFTGTITGATNGDTFTESFSTTATITSDTGTYAIVPSASGPNLSDYTVQTVNGTLTITKASTTTTLSASATSISSGQSVTLTAQVDSATTGTPTGTVSFYDGSTLLGTGTLSAGTATYTTTTLAAGVSHSITATYSGDIDFTTSSSSTAVSIAVGTLDFSINVNGSSSQTISSGAAATYKLNVSPTSGNYPGTVSFSATGLPTGATTTFTPSSIPANGGAQTVTMQVQTAATTAQTQHDNPFGRGGTQLALSLLLLPLLGTRRLRKLGINRSVTLLLLAVAGVVGLVSLSGCGSPSGGGGGGSGSTNYTISVTATSGSVQHGASVDLTVQ